MTQRITPECLARLFHDTYLELKPLYGWEVQPGTDVPFDELPDANRDLMIAVAQRVLENMGLIQGMKWKVRISGDEIEIVDWLRRNIDAGS